jgi:molybdate transport system substrate-binding protein
MLITLSLLASCARGSENDAVSRSNEPALGADPTDCGSDGEITVAGAASLTGAFTAIGEAFEGACEGSTITFTFGSSTTLATQIREGAPVDVFASADESSAAGLTDLAAGSAKVFARNRLVIVTKPANPEQIDVLADLTDVGVVALCASEAPCGGFAAEALAAADVTVDESRVTRGQNAKATLNAVAEGDAVAGIVYLTDAIAASDAVEAVPIPDDQNVVTSYPVVVLDGPGDRALAEAFADALLGDRAQRVLRSQGFGPPR